MRPSIKDLTVDPEEEWGPTSNDAAIRRLLALMQETHESAVTIRHPSADADDWREIVREELAG